MAAAEKTTVTEEVVQTVEREIVRLELTQEEAQYLLDLVGRVSGDGPLRASNDAIYDALSGAGLQYGNDPRLPNYIPLGGN